MAIRKFRKIMKPFTILISVVFVLSLVYGGYESFRTSRANQKAQEALSLNGKKIAKVEIERTKNEVANEYSSMRGIQIDKSLVDIIATNQVIDKFLTLEIAKKLKVKVPSSEVDEQFKQLEDSIGDKEQFRRMLEFQGLTKDSYKAKIEEGLLFTKTIEAFSNEVNPTDEEIKKYYDVRINNRNIELESVKEEIIKEIKDTEGLKKYSEALNLAKKEAKIKDVATEYQNSLETVAYEEEGFAITNLDLAIQTVAELLEGVETKEEAEKIAKEGISIKIKIAKIAKEKGVEVPENLSVLMKLDEYQKGLALKLRDEVVVSDEVLKEFFNTFKTRYEIKASAEVNFAFGNIKPSKEDEEAAKLKAEEVLKAVNTENFEEYGKSLSREEGYLFEDLGTFSKDMMVKEFEEAVSKAEVNSVVKNVVKTDFGYHIIFVKENPEKKEENWTASHILVRVIPSEKTITEKMAKINKIKDDVSAGTVSFTEIPKLDENIVQSILIKGVSPDGLIPNLGYIPEITKEIFDSALNEVKVKENNGGILIFQKVKEIKPEIADFDKAKDTVKNDYINYKAAESMGKITF